MNNAKQVQNNESVVMQTCQDDEIDLGEVFRKIGQSKRFIASFTALSFLGVVAIGVAYLFANPPAETFYKVIKFNFATVSQGTYPSGERFSRNDIVSAPVLSRVYTENKLKDKGIELKDFSAAITATPYAPNIKFIREKYKKLLSNKKLTQTDIQDLEKKYSEELAAAQLKFASINYSTLVGLGLSDEEINKILTDIPKVWSDIAIKDLGVLHLNIPSGRFYDPGLVNQYEYIQAVEYLKNVDEILGNSLKQLQSDQVGAQVRDPKTGFRSSDVIAQLNNLNSFILQPLMSLVVSSGITRNLSQARAYTENKIQQLKDRIETLSEQAIIYRSALELYQQGTNALRPVGPSRGNERNSGTVQYGSDFLSKVTELVEKQKDAVFRQSLLEKEIKLRLKIAELKSQVKELERALARYVQLVQSAHDAQKDLALKKSIDKKLGFARDKLAELVAIYQRIAEIRGERLVNKSGALYDLVSPQLEHQSDLPGKLKKIVLIAVGVSVLALFIAVMITLVRGKREESSGGE